MASLVSEAQKLAWSSVFTDIHDTFSRQIIIYKTTERTDIITDSNHNFIYRDSNFDFNTNIISGSFNARIRWGDPSKEKDWGEIENKIPGNVCRLKLNLEALSMLSGSESIWIDNRPCELLGVNRPHGLFGIDFYTIFCRQKETI